MQNYTAAVKETNQLLKWLGQCVAKWDIKDARAFTEYVEAMPSRVYRVEVDCPDDDEAADDGGDLFLLTSDDQLVELMEMVLAGSQSDTVGSAEGELRERLDVLRIDTLDVERRLAGRPQFLPVDDRFIRRDEPVLVDPIVGSGRLGRIDQSLVAPSARPIPNAGPGSSGLGA